MEANAERTLHNLRVLASVSQNDKLMTNEDRFDIYCPTTLRAMMRMWYGEKRAQNVQRVRATVREAMNFASRSLEEASALLQATSSSDFRLRVDTTAVQHLRMMEALVRAQQGLRNLLQTYREDAALASQITLVVEEITDYVSVLAPHSLALQAQCPNVESCAQDCLRPYRAHASSSSSSSRPRPSSPSLSRRPAPSPVLADAAPSSPSSPPSLSPCPPLPRPLSARPSSLRPSPFSSRPSSSASPRPSSASPRPSPVSLLPPPSSHSPRPFSDAPPSSPSAS